MPCESIAFWINENPFAAHAHATIQAARPYVKGMPATRREMVPGAFCALWRLSPSGSRMPIMMAPHTLSRLRGANDPGAHWTAINDYLDFCLS
jgi:hypothetical protein